MRIIHVAPEFPRLPTHEANRINRRIGLETVAAIIGAVALASFFPQPLFMPMLSAMLVVLGFSIAAISCLRREPQAVAAATHWDQAGMLLFIGFAVAMLSEPAELLAYMEEAKSKK